MTTSALDAHQQDPIEAAAPGIGQRDIVRELYDACEVVRLKQKEIDAVIAERNKLIIEAVDLWQMSHRQVSRATSLSLGRIEGILAND